MALKHEDIKNIFSEIYNSFYLSNRTKEVKRTDEEWEKIISESSRICKKYDNAPMVRHMLLDIIEQFENEEKEIEKKK